MLLKQEYLADFLNALSKRGNLLVPAIVEGNSRFTRYVKGMAVDLDLVNTTLPPKDALFPQTEKMYRYQETAGGVEVTETVQGEAQIIFGIRPCDVQSIACLDDVFLTKGYIDGFYARKRHQLTLVAVGCTKAADSCFCTAMGLNPAAAPPADLLLTAAEDGWNVYAQTPKGTALAASVWEGGILADGEAKPLPAAACAIQADLNGVPEKLHKMFTHEIWEDLHRGCIGCGVCTYLCPACYCFEIGNQVSGAEGYAFRCWDSCMFSEYTRMAGGHNPRPGKKERLRNRYLHKLSYFYQRYGKHLCVGCGRCLRRCPAGLDIVSLIERVGEVEV